MAHIHGVYDVDNHFTIDANTRQIKNEMSNKTSVVQLDHNSERFSFELPRYIDSHDISQCNKVEVHYLNLCSETKQKSTGVYTVDDLQISPDNDDKVLCSWLISSDATTYSGVLSFLLRFCCTRGNVVDYAWNTAVNSEIYVATGLYVSETTLQENVDVIGQWKDSVMQTFTADINAWKEAKAAELEADLIAWKETEEKEIQQLFGDYTNYWDNQIAVERARIDQFTKLGEGSTTGDAELQDIRVGADAKIYESAGAAVREQFRNVHSVVDGVDNLVNANHFAGGVNKFNINDNRVRDNVFINHSGYVEAAGYGVTHPIYVKKGVAYKMPFIDSMGTNNNMAFTDVNGVFVSVEKGIISDGYITFTPSKSGYAVFNLGNRDGTKEMFMVCFADEYPDEYVPFKNPFEHPVNNPLHKKSIAFNGDSICAGAGFEGGYGKIIAQRNSMTYQNVAVGGGTITAETYSGEAKRHWVCRTVEKMNADADYAIFEGGVNDASLKIPLGALSDGYSAELDDTTFIGAFESMLKQAVLRFAGKKIGYIAVHKMTTRYDNRYTENSYYYAAKECCEKWGVPFLDLNTQTPPLNGIELLKQSFTANADGWHPNEAGYNAYYVPKIEAWLKTL